MSAYPSIEETISKRSRVEPDARYDNATATSTKGLRYDANKLGLHLLPVLALGEVAAVLDYGQKKYSSDSYDATDNWRKGLKWRATVGSLLRHSFAFLRGEDRDPESGLLHMAHAACNALFLIQFALTSGGTDDRYKEVQPDPTGTEKAHIAYKEYF